MYLIHKKGRAMSAKKRSLPKKKKFDPNAAAAPGSGIFGLPDMAPEDCRVVLIPVPWQPTTSYRRGTINGPEAVRRASRQVDLFDLTTGNPWKSGIVMLDDPIGIRDLNRVTEDLADPIIARGGDVNGDRKLQGALQEVNANGVKLNRHVFKQTSEWLDLGKIVVVVGGDHSVPFGAIKAYAERHPGMGILHIDAHADLRDAYEGFRWSHASIMYNVQRHIDGVATIVQVGIRDLSEEEKKLIDSSGGSLVSIFTFFDEEISEAMAVGSTWLGICDKIIGSLPKEVYISFDIDGLDPAFCPHTGTPVPGGLSFNQVLVLFKELARKRRIVGFDLNEVAPGKDGDEWDANVAARLLYKMIAYTLMSQDRREK